MISSFNTRAIRLLPLNGLPPSIISALFLLISRLPKSLHLRIRCSDGYSLVAHIPRFSILLAPTA